MDSINLSLVGLGIEDYEKFFKERLVAARKKVAKI